jgi:hypothetical protein
VSPVGNALVPALTLLVCPLAFIAARLKLFRYPTIRYASAVFVLGVVFLEFPDQGFDEVSLNRFKLLFAGAITLILVLRQVGVLSSWSHKSWLGCLAVAAAASITLYTDFFAFHGTAGFAHWHDVAHYYLGSKYFAELGYGNLYVALLRAEQEDGGTIPEGRVVRDLKTNRYVPARELLEKGDGVKAAFRRERWDDFRLDAALFRRGLGPYWPAVLVDHGYNPAPVWTLIGGTLANLVPAGDRRWMLLTLIDPALLVLTAATIAWGFGVETALLAICYFGVIFGTSFGWTGGAYLRFMWFAATIGAAACLHRGWQASAGALFSFAALLRLFPLLFALPVGLRAVGQLRETGGIARGTRRFLYGAASAVIVFGAVSVLVFPGRLAWQEFVRNSHVYFNNLGQNLVGLTALGTVLIGRYTMGGEHLSERLFVLRSHVQQAQILILMPILLAGLAAFANRVSDVTAAALGVLLVFAVLNPGCYYYSFLLLLLLVRPRRLDWVVLLFVVEFMTYLLLLFETPDDVFYLYRSVLVFWLLLIFALEAARAPALASSAMPEESAERGSGRSQPRPPGASLI